MYILDNVPLSGYSTMRLGGPAKHLAEVASRQDLLEAANWAANQNMPVIVIGGGSNIVWSDKGFPGLVIVNKIMRYEVFNEDAENVYVTVGAGEIWDSVVARTVNDGLQGIEGLSLIPGTTGATPVQNVGAYGYEIANTLVSVEAYDSQQHEMVTLPAADCAFGYRTSRFKTTDRGRFFITAITLHLSRGNPQPPFYPSLAEYLREHNITFYSVKIIRDAVIAIRQAKLPDPAVVANNGSFFHNPTISPIDFVQLQADYPNIVHWELDDGRIKISAAWLVEQAGFKGVHDAATGMATWAKQPLVLVNEKANSTAQLIAFRDRIKTAVKQKFNIELSQEPEIIGDM